MTFSDNRIRPKDSEMKSPELTRKEAWGFVLFYWYSEVQNAHSVRWVTAQSFWAAQDDPDR